MIAQSPRAGIALLCLTVAAERAGAVTFQAEFAATTYQVVAGDTHSDALLDGSNSVLDELVRTDDIGWNNDWNDPDVFTTTVDLDAGSSYETNLAPSAAPEPDPALLVAIGLAILAYRRRLPPRT